ncbi:MAG TPA: ACT domain-containing protein [Candidatus Acidoferrum sp.]|nr:ACT domain-containing protein [Candidatus Acidoferrum sp.]
MTHFAMLTAFGQDRPGIVAALAEGLFRLGCNIEDTCMTLLRGEFAMMVMVRLPNGLAAGQLSERLAPHIASLDLTVLCRELPREAAARAPEPDAPLYMLSVYGADHPGIVAKVARVVADHGGNITDMNTRVIGADDRPVYVMILEVQFQADARPESLHQALDRLTPSLGVDLTFRPIEQVRL